VKYKINYEKIAVVTGTSIGLGISIAIQLAKKYLKFMPQ
jgi:short-subunit dehydrogenase